MNGLLVLGIAIVVLAAAYLLYGRYLAASWGIDKGKDSGMRQRGRGRFCPE